MGKNTDDRIGVWLNPESHAFKLIKDRRFLWL